MQDQSPTLNESEILPFQQEDRSADNPMATVMGFASTLLSLEIVGGMDGGINMPEQAAATPAADLDFGFGSPTAPNMMA